MDWRFLAIVSLFPSMLMASDCIAHRGDSIKHPDNTMEAIRSAWEAGADVVEVDVRMLKDGSLVLFHDAEIGKVPIKDLDQPKLQALIPEYRVPTLEEALLAGAAGKALLLDLKEGSEDFLKQVIGQVQTSTISGSRVMLQSTSIPVLKSLREKMPDETALFYVTDLSDKGMDEVKLAKLLVENQLQGITAKGRQFVDAEYVSAFHKRGLKYYVWTINEPERMQHYVGLGVDGVITDDPAGFRKIIPLKKVQKQLPLPGEVFEVDGHTAFVIPPKQMVGKAPMPWVWYAPTLPNLPGKLENWMFEQFLAKGIAIAGVDVGESFGSPAGRQIFNALYQEMTVQRGMSSKPCLLGRSRGGLMLYNWAAEHPGSVSAIAGIYPVCNVRSYPGLGRACGAYGMSAQELESALAEHNPIERLAPLAKAKVPILHLHGDEDRVVPLDDNSAIVKQRYTALGGKMTLVLIPGGGHDGNAHWFTSQELVDFVILNARSE